jgi:hypothetical protein
MPLAFAIFDERLDIIVVESGPVPHVKRLDPENAPARSALEAQKSGAQEIVEGLPESGASRPAFALDPVEHIFVQGDRRADGHDAFNVASCASLSRARSDVAARPEAQYTLLQHKYPVTIQNAAIFFRLPFCDVAF